MTDICLLMRVGTHLDNALRKTLYSMAQYMIEAELESLSFDIVSRSSVATMSTSFKTGSHDSVRGTIFRANIEHGDGTHTETLFLAEYRENWREECVEKWENLPSYAIGGDPDQNWKN